MATVARVSGRRARDSLRRNYNSAVRTSIFWDIQLRLARIQVNQASGVVRIEAIYRGRVQGVGFRYTTRSVARRFSVTGFVKNLSNGHVQLVAKGPNDEVDRFLEAIAEAMPENIRDVQITRLAAVGEFSAFEIAF